MSKKIKFINYGRHSIDDDDIKAVVKTLKSDFITQGPTIPLFEDKIKKYCGVKYGFAVNSATSALHISCLSLGLGPGDILWTSANTFVSSSNCALLVGATVDFVDIDPDTLNMSVKSLEKKLITANNNNCLPKIVIPVHFAGQSCDMKKIYELSKIYGFKIIEDGSHAIGGSYKNLPVGSCKYSDICVFSFHPVKIITTGEGGIALTNSKLIAEKLKKFRSHGIHSIKQKMRKRDPKEIWNYQQVSIGLNYRITDIAASLGLSQMNKLDQFINKRRKIAKFYDSKLKYLPLKRQHEISSCKSTYHLYVIRLNLKHKKITQKKIYNNLTKLGVLVNIHYIPVYRQPFYEDLGFKSGHCPEAESYFREALSIPIYPDMTIKDMEYVSSSLEKVLTL